MNVLLTTADVSKVARLFQSKSKSVALFQAKGFDPQYFIESYFSGLSSKGVEGGAQELTALKEHTNKEVKAHRNAVPISDLPSSYDYKQCAHMLICECVPSFTQGQLTSLNAYLLSPLKSLGQVLCASAPQGLP